MPGLPVLDLEIIKCRVLLISNFSQWRLYSHLDLQLILFLEQGFGSAGHDWLWRNWLEGRWGWGWPHHRCHWCHQWWLIMFVIAVVICEIERWLWWMLKRPKLKESTPLRFSWQKLLLVDVGQLISSENTHLFEFDIFKDLNSKRPGLADTVRRFFTVYKVFLFLFFFYNILCHHRLGKVPSGKGENRFAYNGEFKDNQLAMDVIRFSL